MLAIMQSSRDENGKESHSFVSRRTCESIGKCLTLKGKEAIGGWRHVRKATRDNTEDVPVAFFYMELKIFELEIRPPWNTGVGDHITDVGHTCYIGDQSLESETEPGMGNRSVTP